MRIILILTTVLLLFGCQNQKNSLKPIPNEKLNFEEVLSNNSCLSVLNSSGITKEFVQEFVQLTFKNNDDKVARAFILFYVQRGDMIKNHKVSLVQNIDGEVQSKIFVNQSSNLLKENIVIDYDFDKITSMITDIQNSKEINDNSLLLLDFRGGDIKCKYLENVPSSLGEKIKTLSFLN